MAVDFTIGDYRYRDVGDGVETHVYPSVVDTTKTSYADIPETVEYNGITYTITAVSRCFGTCASLITAPIIPSSVTDMSRCFQNCTSLTTAPTIPSSVTDMSYCFRGCQSLTTAPIIPSSVTSMSACFYGCTSLVTAPTIPSSVTSMSQCFKNCTSLTGKIEVYNNPSGYFEIFTDTTQSITIIVKNLSALSTWQTIADDYSNIVINVDFTILSIDTVNNNATIGNKTTIEDSDITDTIEFESKTFLRKGFHINSSVELSNLITELDWEV